MMDLRPWAIIALVGAAGGAPKGAPVAVGLNHVPVVVSDLEAATRDFGSLGFAMKEGRPHEDGIRNRHMKFTDGTEIELITAPAATDDLTRYYRALLAGGDGAAFLSLYPNPVEVAAARLRAAGLPARLSGVIVDFPYAHPLGYIFLAPLNQSPTDRPEHFAHRNSASRLTSVTLESASFEQERRLFDALGLREESCQAHLAPHVGGTAPAKDAAATTCVPLADGSWLRLVRSPDRARTRITGLGVQVGSLSTLAGVLTESHVAFVRLDQPPPLVAVDGNLTHGVRLEFSSGGPHQ
jgi:hypothetical protein